MNYQQIYQKLIKRGKAKRTFIIKYGRLERHHIIPKHAGGTNDACNITTLHHKEHILAHHLLWKIYERVQDKLAYRMMAGHIHDIWEDPAYAAEMRNKVCQNLQKADRQKQKEATSKVGVMAKKNKTGIFNPVFKDKIHRAGKEWAATHKKECKERSSKSHRNRTQTDYEKMAATKSHHIIIAPTGEQFLSASAAAHYFHLPIYTIDNWSRRGSKGWSRIAAGKA